LLNENLDMYLSSYENNGLSNKFVFLYDCFFSKECNLLKPSQIV
jgi:hypothetical protein